MRKIATLFVCAVIFASACGPDQRILDSAKEKEAEITNSNVAPAVSSFEKDVQAMRNADFKFIVVLRRKDGNVLDAADKALISESAAQANRRSLSDGGKAVVIGSNFQFPADEYKKLNEKFAVENLSKPDSGSMISNASPAANVK